MTHQFSYNFLGSFPDDKPVYIGFTNPSEFKFSVNGKLLSPRYEGQISLVGMDFDVRTAPAFCISMDESREFDTTFFLNAKQNKRQNKEIRKTLQDQKFQFKGKEAGIAFLDNLASFLQNNDHPSIDNKLCGVQQNYRGCIFSCDNTGPYPALDGAIGFEIKLK